MHKLITLALTAWFVAACSLTSGVSTRYYVLSEKPPRIIEVDPTLSPDERSVRHFDLDVLSLSENGPEGVAFVPNSDIEQFGLPNLPTSAHGGYFLVVTQKNTRLYVLELPLNDSAGELVTVVHDIPILNLASRASDIHYADGQIWITFDEARELYQLKMADTGGQFIESKLLHLDSLSAASADVEGFTLSEPDIAFVADDSAHIVSRYDDFLSCSSDALCTATWSQDVSPREPSGLAWDPIAQKLIVVDDEGDVFSLDGDGNNLETILRTDNDLEGITVVISERSLFFGL